MYAVGYVRTDTNNSDSVRIQIDVITEYCKTHQINLKKIFVDIGHSGLRFNRPGFQKMLSSIRSKKKDVDLIITVYYDRIARKFNDLFVFNNLLAKHHVSIVSIHDIFAGIGYDSGKNFAKRYIAAGELLELFNLTKEQIQQIGRIELGKIVDMCVKDASINAFIVDLSINAFLMGFEKVRKNHKKDLKEL